MAETLRDLVPFPNTAEQLRALRRLGDTRDMDPREFKQALAAEIRKEREGRA